MTRIARVAWLIAIPFRIVLAATLILAATAALLRSRPIRALSCRLGWCRCAFLEGSDGSEIVGMPTTWDDPLAAVVAMRLLHPDDWTGRLN